MKYNLVFRRNPGNGVVEVQTKKLGPYKLPLFVTADHVQAGTELIAQRRDSLWWVNSQEFYTGFNVEPIEK